MFATYNTNSTNCIILKLICFIIVLFINEILLHLRNKINFSWFCYKYLQLDYIKIRIFELNEFLCEVNVQTLLWPTIRVCISSARDTGQIRNSKKTRWLGQSVFRQEAKPACVNWNDFAWLFCPVACLLCLVEIVSNAFARRRHGRVVPHERF